MTSTLLIVEPVEALALMRTPIPGPRYLGTRVSLFYTPQPTTIVGVIGRALDVTVDRMLDLGRLEDIESVVKDISERLACSVPMLMGPLLASEDLGEIYLPLSHTLYVAAGLLEEVLRHGCRSQSLSRIERPAGSGFDAETLYVELEPCYERAGNCVEAFALSPITGVSLERRFEENQKTTRPGYMYRFSLVVYRDVLTKNPLPLKTVYLLNCERGLNALTRVGGEGRIAKVYTESKNMDSLANLANPITRLEPGLYLSVGYIPMVPKTSETISLRLDDFYGLEFLDNENDIIGVPQSKVCSPPKLRVERLGLGFSESQVKMRPQILALPPGTLLKVRDRRGPLKGVKIIRTLWSIGYSTLYKLR